MPFISRDISRNTVIALTSLAKYVKHVNVYIVAEMLPRSNWEKVLSWIWVDIFLSNDFIAMYLKHVLWRGKVNTQKHKEIRPHISSRTPPTYSTIYNNLTEVKEKPNLPIYKCNLVTKWATERNRCIFHSETTHVLCLRTFFKVPIHTEIISVSFIYQNFILIHSEVLSMEDNYSVINLLIHA